MVEGVRSEEEKRRGGKRGKPEDFPLSFIADGMDACADMDMIYLGGIHHAPFKK
ncbi:MAG: hypothetical protein ACUVRX_05410 [Actinomycetota bacterium]